jgi:hypothetical protein
MLKSCHPEGDHQNNRFSCKHTEITQNRLITNKAQDAKFGDIRHPVL